jgi:peptide/nickel transport system substrate-binding protein
LALLAAACAADDGSADASAAALSAAQGALSDATVAQAEAAAAGAAAEAAAAAAAEAAAAADLAHATAEGNQEAVAAAEAALAEAQNAADEARDQAAAAQDEADDARAAAEAAQEQAAAAAEAEAPAAAPEPPAATPEPPPPAPAAASAVPDEVVFALAGPVLAINPDGPGQNNLPSVGIFFSTYDGLTEWKVPSNAEDLFAVLEQGNAAQAFPALAESWDISDDGSVYTFHLREGVMSDFGNEMTAEDVRWSLEKSMSGFTTGAFWISLGGLKSIDQVEVVDDYTVRISGLFGDKLLPALGSGWLAIYDSAEVQKYATEEDPYANEWLNQNAAGYGPYRVESFGPGGDEVILEARENYWDYDNIALKRVIQRSVPDANSRLQLLLSGDVAFAAELTSLGVEQAKDTDGVSVTRIPTTTGAFLALYYEPPFDDPAVRAAIAQAIPYDDIIDVVFQGDATLWDSVLIPPIPGYTNEFFRGTDIAAASAVLSELDVPLTLAYADGLPLDEEIAILVQSSFREAGFDLNIEKQPRAQFDGRKYGRTGELQFFVDLIDAPAFFDAHYFAFLFGGVGGFTNWFGYESPELEAGLAAILDPATTAEGIVEVQRVFARDYPIHPIAWTGLDYAHADYLDLPSVVTGNGLVRMQDFVAAGG